MQVDLGTVSKQSEHDPIPFGVLTLEFDRELNEDSLASVRQSIADANIAVWSSDEQARAFFALLDPTWQPPRFEPRALVAKVWNVPTSTETRPQRDSIASLPNLRRAQGTAIETCVDTTALHLGKGVCWRRGAPPGVDHPPIALEGQSALEQPDDDGWFEDIGIVLRFESALNEGHRELLRCHQGLWVSAFEDRAPPPEGDDGLPVVEDIERWSARAFRNAGCDFLDEHSVHWWMDRLAFPGDAADAARYLYWVLTALHALLPIASGSVARASADQKFGAITKS